MKNITSGTKTTTLYLAGVFIMSVCLSSMAQNYHPERVIVSLREGVSLKKARAFAVKNDLSLNRIIPKAQVAVFNITTDEPVPAVIKRLAVNKRVFFCEPDYVRVSCAIPNDPLFALQWNMPLIEAPQAWDSTTGDGNIVVAVVDTGLDLDHPELIDRLWVNDGEIPGNGVDDDGNGYVDDYVGYDFAGDGAIFTLPGAEDPIPDDLYSGHGTHVGGVIAAEQNNGIGISGIAPTCRLMAVRVLGGALGSGYSSDIVEGIIYAVDNGAGVINMSLGGANLSLAEYSALAHAWDNNVLVIAASGNDGDGSNVVSYPAAYVFTVSVAATDAIDNVASFSTRNVWVELSAPGVNILSTVPDGGYEGDWSGTSMATPHVSGGAALIYSYFPGIRNWQARTMLQQSAVDLGPVGHDKATGFGRLDCEAALAAPVPSPSDLRIIEPADGVVFSADTLVSMLWNPVPGTLIYRLNFVLPSGAAYLIEVDKPYYTVHPRTQIPDGTYSLTVEAIDASGSVINEDSITFSYVRNP